MANNQDTKGCLVFVGIITLIVAIFVLWGTFSDSNDSSTSSSTIDLNAGVNFNGTQFTITNNDTFDWSNIEMEVNSKYKLKGGTFKSGETYTVGAMQFTKNDGERFNPFLIKPQKFSIKCYNQDGKTGYYFGGWD